MRSKKIREQKGGNSFELSISDLMAALCCIFILFLVFTIRKLNIEREDFKKKNAVATEYRMNQQNLYNALQEEFKSDLEKWGAEIKMENGTVLIRFKNEKMMFPAFESTPKQDFENVLKDFFPRYVNVIENENFREQIEEVRIEGHTAREVNNKSITLEEDYKSGVKLSQDRTREVMLFCLSTLNSGPKQWVQDKMAAIGYSLSRPMLLNNEINWERSRRVEFSIRTTAEKVISEMENTN